MAVTIAAQIANDGAKFTVKDIVTKRRSMKSLLLLILVLITALISLPSAYAGEGHDAGYEWAEENDITDTDYDEGNSESFNEGVREYAEEQEELEEEDEEY